MEIKPNETYNYFDDGKISESRRSSVVITEVIPFDKIDKETFSEWEEEVNECDWLYAKETDYFIKANLILGENNIESITFVRTLNNGWFSLGWFGGRLDYDGSLYDMIKS